jgi:hypothetical protein
MREARTSTIALCVGVEERDVCGQNCCSEFASQSCQNRVSGANWANSANLKMNNLHGISGLRENESLFLRHTSF